MAIVQNWHTGTANSSTGQAERPIDLIKQHSQDHWHHKMMKTVRYLEVQLATKCDPTWVTGTDHENGEICK